MPLTTRTKRGNRFTLLEVVIALAILGLSLGLMLQLIGGSRERLLRAEERWERQHRLAAAAEFYLLGGPKADPLPGLLPDGCTPGCELAVPDDLPDNATDAVSGWILGRYRITVTGPDGKPDGEMTVERLVREDDIGQ